MGEENPEFAVEQIVEEKLKERESESDKNNSIKVSSHSISVHINSQTTEIDELTDIANEIMREREKQALRGEYEVLEEEDLFIEFLP